MKKLTTILAILLITSTATAQANEEMIIGVWTTGSGNARIKIEKIGSKYYGKTVWLEKPTDAAGKPKLDTENPDKALQGTPRLGLRIMKDFLHDGAGAFSGGNIYDPEKGKTYCGKLSIKDANTLVLRGYICGFKMLGKNDTWKKYVTAK